MKILKSRLFPWSNEVTEQSYWITIFWENCNTYSFLQITFNGYFVKSRKSNHWEGGHLGSPLPSLVKSQFGLLFQEWQIIFQQVRKMYPLFSPLSNLLPKFSIASPNSLLLRILKWESIRFHDTSAFCWRHSGLFLLWTSPVLQVCNDHIRKMLVVD